MLRAALQESYLSKSTELNFSVFISSYLLFQCFKLNYKKQVHKEVSENIIDSVELGNMLTMANIFLRSNVLKIEDIEQEELNSDDKKINRPDMVVIDKDSKIVRCDLKTGDVRFSEIKDTFAKYCIKDDDYILMLYLKIGLTIKDYANKNVEVLSYWKELDSLYFGK